MELGKRLKEYRARAGMTQDELAEKLDEYGYRYSKGSIQIPYTGDLPLRLISEIAAWCRDTGNHA